MDRERLAFTKTPNSVCEFLVLDTPGGSDWFDALSFLLQILVRLIDDFIYISTSQNDAERFLKVMADGSKEYGCFISMEKTLINFRYGGVKQVVGNGTFGFPHTIKPHTNCVDAYLYEILSDFPWCGHLINTKTLEFKAEMARFNGIRKFSPSSIRHYMTQGSDTFFTISQFYQTSRILWLLIEPKPLASCFARRCTSQS